MEFLFTILALFLGIVLSCKFLTIFLKKEPENLPPGNFGWPLIGETSALLEPHNSNNSGTFIQDHCLRYGKVYKSHIFGTKTIISCDLELNKYILQNSKLFRSSYPKAIRDILGKYSLILVTGDLHKKLRNIIVSFVSTYKTSPEFIQTAQKLTISLTESWKGCKEVSFNGEVKKFTFAMIMKQLLSLEQDDKIGSMILEAFETFMRGFDKLPVYIPGTAYAKAIQGKARACSIIKNIIEERRGNLRLSRGDFLDVIIEKPELNDDERISLAIEILFGGYETTSILLSLAVYFLANSSRVILEKLREEHLEIRNSKINGEFLDFEDYKKMEFTQMVINESLRCGNVVKFIQREAAQDVKFNGHFIPAGWKVIPIFTATHLDETLHKNPLEFNPWRWTDKATSKKVTPFGGGLRLCPGADLAKIEASFFLHHFILKFNWKTKPDDFPIAYPYIQFQRGCLLEIEPIEKTLK